MVHVQIPCGELDRGYNWLAEAGSCRGKPPVSCTDVAFGLQSGE